MILVFSQRHENSLKEKKLTVSLPSKLRRKIIYCMRNHDQAFGWNNENSILYDSLSSKLLEVYGTSELRAYNKDSLDIVEHIEEFIKGAYPPQVIDSIEVFNQLIDKHKDKISFGRDINVVFRSENSPYRLLENEVVVLDSKFLESSILNSAFELLKSNAFEKACKDFLNARNNYTAGDYSGTIVECNNAIESTLKKILDVKKGDQSTLKSQLMKSGIIPEYFQGFSDHFEGLLQSAFTISNQSARHGLKEPLTGKNKVDGPLAAFILHLTGSMIVFIIERYEETLPEEDIPF